jgi:hypothetical protein
VTSACTVSSERFTMLVSTKKNERSQARDPEHAVVSQLRQADRWPDARD